MNINELFHTGGNPDSVAFVHVKSSSSRTIRDKGLLWRNVASLRAFLTERGARKGGKALILSGTGAESIEMLLASFDLGIVAMPVDPFMGRQALLNLIDSHAPSVCMLGDIDLDTAELLGARCRICIGVRGPVPGGAAVSPYSEIVARKGAEYDESARNASDDDLALIMHTSGSRGKPKSILFSHQDLKDFFATHDYHYSQYITEEEIASGVLSPFLSTLPFSHLGGLAICLQGLIMKRPTYLLSHFTPRSYLSLMSETKCSTTMLVPSMYATLLDELRNAPRRFDSLKYCITLGEGCSLELRRRIGDTFGATVTSACGLTECQSGLGFTRDELIAGRVKPGSCGRLLYGEAKLVDERGNEADEGELWVRNETVHECYGDASLNRQKITDGWFRTGDLFHRDGDGYFFHKGRVDDMFVSKGKNIYPQEVEETLLGHPSISRVCVSPVSDRNGNTVVAAIVELRAEANEQDIIAYVLKHGSTHSVPRLIKLVSEIPEVGPKKVDRTTCKRLLQDEYDRRTRAVATSR